MLRIRRRCARLSFGCAVQPDGSVWTAGSTHTGADLTDPDSATHETRIEVFRPSYGGNRPQIDDAPDSVSYGETFTIRMVGSAAMHRVVLIRCGLCRARPAGHALLTVSGRV